MSPSVRVRMPDSMVHDALGTLDVDRLVGARLAVPGHAGHLLASSDLAAQTTTLPPGRTRLAIASNPPARRRRGHVDVVAVFWDGKSTGTKNAVDRARRLGKSIWMAQS